MKLTKKLKLACLRRAVERIKADKNECICLVIHYELFIACNCCWRMKEIQDLFGLTKYKPSSASVLTAWWPETLTGQKKRLSILNTLIHELETKTKANDSFTRP